MQHRNKGGGRYLALLEIKLASAMLLGGFDIGHGGRRGTGGTDGVYDVVGGITHASRVDAYRLIGKESKMSAEKDQFQRDLLESVRQMRAGESARVIVVDTSAATAEISLRLQAEVVNRWKATGPGWQSRMAEVLSNASMA